jgi:hypothetical protein
MLSTEIRIASRRHHPSALLKFVKCGQVWFHIREEHPACLGELRFPAMDFEQPNAQLLL